MSFPQPTALNGWGRLSVKPDCAVVFVTAKRNAWLILVPLQANLIKIMSTISLLSVLVLVSFANSAPETSNVKTDLSKSHLNQLINQNLYRAPSRSLPTPDRAAD